MTHTPSTPPEDSLLGPVALKPGLDWSALDHVDTWIFDLDNTLYAAGSRLFDQVHRRMTAFIMESFSLDREAALTLQRDYFRAHGSTLRGLMLRHGLDPHDYLNYVHDIDVSVLPPAPELGAAIDRLPGRKLVFTAGSTAHADRILTRMGIADRFEAIFDIVAADFVPKPAPEVYDLFCSRYGVDAATAVLFEDSARNLAPAAALGMRTVWINTGEPFSLLGSKGDHIDWVSPDLSLWLEAYLAHLDTAGQDGSAR
ncbi:pyrimidine 5'-nucleotidase [uncultured Tistrella sp.]|uniref:pyrimidine 5'-nucleotidase n=1 Tax=Tistrella mobilis TaxID=171437 RepID=UPI000C0B8B1A|nr:pyrimidine 5'-nucleotidase [uncultured Tistrella sp.]MAM74216.1 pyrimidine 5'-nucleotidase [Tistrella sp.]